MNSYEQNRREDERLASIMAETRQRQKHTMSKTTYHFFVSGHTHFSDGMDEPRPVNISTITTLEHPLLDDHDLDELTENVKQELDTEAEKVGMTQVGYPTIRQVNLLHTTK